jgi:hypothetical protein
MKICTPTGPQLRRRRAALESNQAHLHSRKVYTALAEGATQHLSTRTHRDGSHRDGGRHG